RLFFRGVATNAPAIPMLSDAEYGDVFPQDPRIGLSPLGEAAVRAMYKHRVLVDISHMSQKAIDDTFELIDELDRATGGGPSDYPVIATHVGMRDVEPHAQDYNLSRETALRIQERGGLIGLILAQHQLGQTQDEAESRAVLRKHLNAIGDVGHGHVATAI